MELVLLSRKWGYVLYVQFEPESLPFSEEGEARFHELVT